ncbi:hypothetical protein ACFOY5_10865 [Massilia aurea]|uniref:hypothetical protein n=1 Tax=Massilia aurea TaxID=373040 RepID=UPI0021621B20|nr:hypothetical protein [Massilia aurea]MCS0709441.1 hypothetical protein [Massilia aurea]
MTQQYDQDYLKKAIAEEREVARLDLRVRTSTPGGLGLSIDSNVYLMTGHIGSGSGIRTSEILPKWRRHPRAAGALAIKHALNIKHDLEECTVTVGYGPGRRGIVEHYGAHPDHQAATMAAIVRAAIQMLTEKRDEAAALNPTRAPARRRVAARPKTK